MPHNFKFVSSEYIKDKILSKEYNKKIIAKNGEVFARNLNKGETVDVYFYDENVKIQTKPFFVPHHALILVTKTINKQTYQSIMEAFEFHKKHYLVSKNIYKPVFDPFTAYETNEPIEFINIYEQKVRLNPIDLIVPFNAKFESFYSIYQQNFLDNYFTLEDNYAI